MQQPSEPNPIAHTGQALPRRLDLQHMHPQQLGAEFPRRLRHRRDQSLSERHNIAMPLHPIAGGDARQHMPIARHLPSTSAIRTRDWHEPGCRPQRCPTCTALSFSMIRMASGLAL